MGPVITWFASPVQLTPLKSSSFRLFWLFLDLLKMVLVEPIPPRRRVGLRMQFEAGRWRGGIGRPISALHEFEVSAAS